MARKSDALFCAVLLLKWNLRIGVYAYWFFLPLY